MVTFALFWLALIAQRLAEVDRARRNTERLRKLGGREFASGHYPLMVALHTAWFAAWLAEVIQYGPHWQSQWLGLALVGQGLRWWAQSVLGQRWTTRIIVIPGEKPVTDGPFRWCPHPNYLGVVLELLAFPLLFGAWRTALAFSLANAFLLQWRITMEERAWKTSGS